MLLAMLVAGYLINILTSHISCNMLQAIGQAIGILTGSIILNTHVSMAIVINTNEIITSLFMMNKVVQISLYMIISFN